ncbi:MAG: sugar phosphate isomerase/epimerase, partial [Rhodospirillales bacterium]|nr:sugar phosphate isomerase/epimerase [Rhodospirillales bacterium]
MGAAAASGAVAALGRPGAALAAASAPRPRVKLGISTYSYWHFRDPKVPVEHVIDEASRLEVPGVDILHRQMDAEDAGYCNKLKRHAFLNGVDLIALSIHQDFVDPDPEYRKKQVEHTVHCLELAHQLGIPTIRLNSGRWNTIKSFDDLMAARGIEPLPEGITEEQGFDWCIESIEQCLKVAEKLGVVLALENHWGLGLTPEGVLKIVDAIKSPWLQVTADTGNFLEDPYDRLATNKPQLPGQPRTDAGQPKSDASQPKTPQGQTPTGTSQRPGPAGADRSTRPDRARWPAADSASARR